jgi:hypothetical protein
MLLRELVRRHVQPEDHLALAGDPEMFPDLERVCRWTEASAWTDEKAPDAVLVDLGDDPGAALEATAGRWPQARTWVLVHAALAGDLPLAPVIAAARRHGLHLVEAVALPGRHKVGVVASSQPAPVVGYLNGHPVDQPDEDAAARMGWEWALGTLAARAKEAVDETTIARLTAERDRLATRLQQAQERLEQQQAAVKEELAGLRRKVEAARVRDERVRSSASFVLGQHLVTMRKHPVKGLRGLMRDRGRIRKERREG